MSIFLSRCILLKRPLSQAGLKAHGPICEEVLSDEQDVAPGKRDDRAEEKNYFEAINAAIQQLESLPLSNRLLKNTHKILMQGVRGETRLPGEFRTSQNWIGVGLKNAIFVPPHQDDVLDLMSDMEKFIQNQALLSRKLFREIRKRLLYKGLNDSWLF